MANQPNMTNQPKKDVIVVDYNFNINYLSVENIHDLIAQYLRANSYSHSQFSGVPFLMNLHLVSGQPKPNTSRLFVPGSKDDVVQPYRGYNADGTIAPIDVAVTIPIFPACFEKECFVPLYNLITSNFRQLEMRKLNIENLIKQYKIPDDSVLFNFDQIRDAILVFSIDRYQSSYDRVSGLFRQIDEWFTRFLPQYRNDALKFLSDCFNYSSDRLMPEVKFIAYGDKDNIEQLSDILEKKDEKIIEKQIESLATTLTNYVRKKLANQYHLLEEMSFGDVAYNNIPKDTPIADINTSAYHSNMASAISRSNFFESYSKDSSPVYDYLLYNGSPEDSPEQKIEIDNSRYCNEKFAEMLIKMLKLYGGGGSVQKQYCDQLDNSQDLPKNNVTVPKDQPQTKKKPDIWHTILNKLGLSDNNNNGPQNPLN